MSCVCSSTSAVPIAAKPSRFALRNGYGWKARTCRGVVRIAAANRAPIVLITRTAPALPAPSSSDISNGVYSSDSRPANCPAYAMRSSAMCTAVSRQLHVTRPAGVPSQSRSVTSPNRPTHSSTACSTCSAPVVHMPGRL